MTCSITTEATVSDQDLVRSLVRDLTPQELTAFVLELENSMATLHTDWGVGLVSSMVSSISTRAQKRLEFATSSAIESCFSTLRPNFTPFQNKIYAHPDPEWASKLLEDASANEKKVEELRNLTSAFCNLVK